MKTILKLEELAMFLASIVFLFWVRAEWWMYLLVLLGPDISMLGYLAGNRAGAFLYNLFHHKGIGLMLFIIGYIVGWLDSWPWFFYAGIIIFGHASLDRFFGYGLKYENGFKFTHLGEIGKK